jgi:bridging integrator 3
MRRYLAFKGQDFPLLLEAFALKVPRYFPETVRDDYAAGQLDAQVCRLFVFNYFFFVIPMNICSFKVEGVLQEMKELSICGAT